VFESPWALNPIGVEPFVLITFEDKTWPAGNISWYPHAIQAFFLQTKVASSWHPNAIQVDTIFIHHHRVWA